MKQLSVEQLLRRVRLRIWLADLGGHCFHLCVAAVLIYSAVLTTGRLTGLLVFPIPWWGPLLACLAATLVAVLRCRPPTPTATAHAADSALGGGDVFLSSLFAGTDTAAGALVARQARELARGASGASVRALRPWPWLTRIGVLCGIAVAFTLHVPVLDPFGRLRRADERIAAETRLAEARQRTVQRVAELRRDRVQEPHSAAVGEVLGEALRALQDLRVQDAHADADLLAQRRRHLTELWEQLESRRLRFSEHRLRSGALLGDPGSDRRWAGALERLLEGDAEALHEALDQAQQRVDELASATDPATRERLAEELTERVRGLARAASRQGVTAGMTEAMQRVLQELRRSGDLDPAAAEALREALKQVELEGEALAQALRDARGFQQAVDALRAAEAFARTGAPARAATDQQLQSLEAYASLYRQLTGEGCDGGEGNTGPVNGQVPKGRGQGGGLADEDPDGAGEFVSESSPGQPQPGDTVAQWHEPDSAGAGVGRKGYAQVRAAAEERAAEAALRERVPPGYHDVVKRYFDH